MAKKIITDCIFWIWASVICILWRLLAHKMEMVPYITLFVLMMVAWVVLGLLVCKYRRSYIENWLWQDVLTMGLTGGLLMVATRFTLPLMGYHFSMTVSLWTIGIVMITDFLFILAQHYWKFALNINVPPMVIEQRANANVTREDKPRSQASLETVHQAVLSLTTEEDYQMLLDKAHLDNRRTKVVANRDRFSFVQIPDYQYDTLVDLTLLNDAKGINKRFCIVNQKLPDEGKYVCCYRPQEYVKAKLLSSYPKGINWIVFLGWFIYRRVIPRLLLMSRLYYDLTKGRKRTLSKTEVLGRLYYCGFEVDEIVPMGHIEYVFAHRHSQPYEQENLKLYGPLIKLPRVCKDKEIKYFYKFRTMHPYSEYIQKYVFDQRGGMNIADKSDDDWRITVWGHFLRKYWLDELPMLINWLKRDVKLVGVRPLSRTMFDQYPKELQDKRTLCKPGLIPPFYVDHPNTFEELYASENKYLDEYLQHPVWTDTKYFFLTMRSILFKKMHSA
ncbi:MAG: sugar transferase [Paludibacteraceae bacterium]|nr:sugar transferase [Paludibacteraceae bacterium]